jgi:hypothetical protein
MHIVKYVALRLRSLMEEREMSQNMSNQTNIPNSELSETNRKITNSLISVKGLSVPLYLDKGKNSILLRRQTNLH